MKTPDVEFTPLDDILALEDAAEAKAATNDDELAFDEFDQYALDRDPHRWELDPASSEDYAERSRGGYYLRWRHFGH